MVYCLNSNNLLDRLDITLPASKSLSNRALIIKALCEDDASLSNLSDCDDTKVMLAAFQPGETDTEGVRTVDIGAAGTSMRFLTAYFATRPGAEVIMTGSKRMKERPIRILVDALRTLGAEIEYLENDGFPPLHIHGKQLAGGPLSIDGSTSSQYISALLMIAPTLTKGLQLTLCGNITSRPYIEMTLSLMKYFGVKSIWNQNLITVARQNYQAQDYCVENDWSAASYWYEIGTLGRIPEIKMKGLHKNSLQGDCAVADMFLSICNSSQETFEVDLSETPDLAQTIICTLCALRKPFSISGLHTLRIKETDRVAALKAELLKLGYTVKDFEENNTVVMTYDGNKTEHDTNAVIETYKDHRMAMAFAPLCLVLGNININEPSVVSKSYPHYWDDLKSAGFEITEKE